MSESINCPNCNCELHEVDIKFKDSKYNFILDWYYCIECLEVIEI